MSDLQRLKDLLDSWDVPYLVDSEGEGGFSRPFVVSVIVGEGPGIGNPYSDRVDGFPGFFTRYDFSVAGVFLRMGAWE